MDLVDKFLNKACYANALRSSLSFHRDGNSLLCDDKDAQVFVSNPAKVNFYLELHLEKAETENKTGINKTGP